MNTGAACHDVGGVFPIADGLIQPVVKVARKLLLKTARDRNDR